MSESCANSRKRIGPSSPSCAASRTKQDASPRELFSGLTPWQKVQLSRHPARPYTLDYIERLFDGFVELHGDRSFGDDAAIVGGLARFHGRSVMVLGHQKGRGAKDNVKRNFQDAAPRRLSEGRRLYEMASRFGLPIVTLIDTPGAYPGIGAEERGQSEAIGACLAVMSRARVPIVATIIGEGGSGGALALGVANRVLVLEYGTYSVISPEGCASDLWKERLQGRRSRDAAEDGQHPTSPALGGRGSDRRRALPAARIKTTPELVALFTPRLPTL